MSRSLHLLRHAAAESGIGIYDADRALTPAGRSTAAALAPRIAQLAPQLVLCSPAKRAVETAEALGVEFDVHDGLYLAEAGDLLEVLRTVDDDIASVLVVGHNPGLENLTTIFTGTIAAIGTGQLVSLDGPARWSDLGER